jgi:glycine/D-amino acid oxidase-like deaminating enzyme
LTFYTSLSCHDSHDYAQPLQVDILASVAEALNALEGSVYTGCDMNMGIPDMEKLHKETPYVLASLGGDEKMDANEATAWGVIGSVHGALEARGGVKGKTILVHGTGQVGSTTARVLAEAGADVCTFDLFSERADIVGCTNLSHLSTEEFLKRECDMLIPCSVANLINDENVQDLGCQMIVSAANLPFATKSVRATAEVEKKIMFWPESICSAGAIILDSVEMYSNQEYCAAKPSEMYQFVAGLTEKKAIKYGAMLEQGIREESAAASSRTQEYVGKSFKSALSQHTVAFTTNTTTMRQAARGLSTAAHPQQYDTVIAGAGIMGLNIAYQLKRRDPSHQVLVLESADVLGRGSSGYSTGFQRAYYSFDNTMEFALTGIHAYKNWSDYLQNSEADAFFTQTDALWMLGYTREKNLEMQERLKKFGVGSEVIDEAEYIKRFPLMSPEPFPDYDLETGEIKDPTCGEFSAVFEHGAGHIDSNLALADCYAACVREGVTVRFNSKVQAFETSAEGDVVKGVRMLDGTTVEGKNVINCTGPWFQALNDTAGVVTSTNSLPTRIQVAHKYVPEEYWNLPFVADAFGNSGIYFMPRRANGQMVFGSIANRFESEVVDPDNYNEALDPDFKQDYLNCLFHRLPGLDTSGEIQGFSSMYTVNQDDVHPVMGETKEVEGLYVCNGFSGHGFKLAPAVGSLMAQAITGIKIQDDAFETNIPLDFMGPNREPLTLEVKTHFA